jgi:signal transduction histidine kinase
MTNRPLGRDHRAVTVTTTSCRRHFDGVAAVAALVALTLAASMVAAAVDRGNHSYYLDEVVGGLVSAITAVVGAMVALAAPRNVIGWFILGSSTLGALAEALTEAGVHGVRTAPGSVPGAAYLVTFGVALRTLAPLLTDAAVPAYYPDGRLAGPRYRWLGWTLTATVLVVVIAGVLAPIETRLGNNWHGPFTPAGKLGDSLQGLDILGVLLIIICAVGAFAGLVHRWRRGGPVVRQQLLLFGCAIAVSVLFLIAVLTVVIATSSSGPPRFVFSLASLPLPIAVAIAVVNRGLYDLRRAANRTILWLLVTTSIAALYVVVVVAAAAASPDRSAWWPPALAAGVAALALVPLRDRLQRLVHRVVYGRWREPYEVLSGLAGQLQAAGDVDRLLDAAVAQLGTELDLELISVRDAAGTVVAGAADRANRTVALHAYNSVVGELCFRDPDRQLSASEQRLIRDLAGHLGGTMHARSLLDDLQRTRERLVLAREEERRRLRRDLHDGIGPALAGLTLKAETARALLTKDTDAAAQQLSDLSEEIRATVVDVRRVVEGLRPPALDELGLLGACRQAVDRLTSGSGIAAEVRPDQDTTALPAAVEVAAFRIVLEAVTNVVRHAHARHCCVTLARNDAAVVVTVADDGTGLVDGAGAGHGLATMRERAEELGGTFAVVASESGLQVTALLPTRLAGAVTS